MQKSLLKLLPNGHSLFAPSASGRWITCPGSIPLIASILKQKEIDGVKPEPMSIYAAEGTLMHLAGAKLLENKKPIKVNSTRTIDGHKVKFTKEFNDAVNQYVDVVHYFLNQYPGNLHVEKRMDLSAFGFPEIKGTSDTIIDACPVLIIIDYKGGAGVQVTAQNNSQMKIYSAMALSYDAFLYKKVINVIVQPRHRFSEFYSSVEYDAYEIEEYINQTVTQAIENAHSENPTFQPSKKACKWCEAKETMACEAFKKFSFYQAQKDFKEYKEFEPMKPQEMSADELSSILKALPLLNEFISSVNQYALNQLQKGKEIPGFELKEGRSNRKWAEDNPNKMAKILKTFGLKYGDIWTKKIKGPATIEKIVKNETDREELFKYIIKPKGKPTIGTIDDTRPNLEAENTPQKDFEKVNVPDFLT